MSSVLQIQVIVSSLSQEIQQMSATSDRGSAILVLKMPQNLGWCHKHWYLTFPPVSVPDHVLLLHCSFSAFLWGAFCSAWNRLHFPNKDYRQSSITVANSDSTFLLLLQNVSGNIVKWQIFGLGCHGNKLKTATDQGQREFAKLLKSLIAQGDFTAKTLCGRSGQVHRGLKSGSERVSHGRGTR